MVVGWCMEPMDFRAWHVKNIRSDRILSHRIHGAGIFAYTWSYHYESILWLRKITPQYSIFDPQILDELPYSLRLDEKTFPPFNRVKSSHISMFSGYFWNTSSFLGFFGSLDFLSDFFHLGAGNVANRCLTRPSAHVDFWPWDDGWDSWWSFDWRWTGAAPQLSKLPNYSLLGGQRRKWMDFSEKMKPTKRSRL